MKTLIDPIETALAQREQETAALETGTNCPICASPMIAVTSMGEPARFCEKHNIALPELPE